MSKTLLVFVCSFAVIATRVVVHSTLCSIICFLRRFSRLSSLSVHHRCRVRSSEQVGKLRCTKCVCALVDWKLLFIALVAPVVSLHCTLVVLFWQEFLNAKHPILG